MPGTALRLEIPYRTYSLISSLKYRKAKKQLSHLVSSTMMGKCRGLWRGGAGAGTGQPGSFVIDA